MTSTHIHSSDTKQGSRFFLVGMMGSGKSYWMRKMSGMIQGEAYDLDALIETSEGKSIAQIFAEHGESYFREREAELLRSFEHKTNFVLATGGGTPCFHDNMLWMNTHGTTIWIDRTVDVLIEHLLKGKDHRPLIKELSNDQLHDFISKKLNERLPYYVLSSYRLQNEDVTEERFKQIISENA